MTVTMFNIADFNSPHDMVERGIYSLREVTSCPAPYLAESDYPATGGYVTGRSCRNLTESLSCCLPCPVRDWIYSESVIKNEELAQWLAMPGLIVLMFLLVTFVVLKEKYSRRHYLSVGLIISLSLYSLADLTPLGTKPDMCFNAITPGDMNTSQSCAWTGALAVLGPMASATWILSRSLYTHLRVCWDLERPQTWAYMWFSCAMGLFVPILFLGISLAFDGVSYQLNTTCVSNARHRFITWYGWLLGFACLAGAFQFATTGYCIFVYIRNVWTGSGVSNNIQTLNPPSKPRSLQQAETRRRVQEILLLQWRSIALSFVVIVELVYSCYVFESVYDRSKKAASSSQAAEWGACLIETGGDKNACLYLAHGLDIDPSQVQVTSILGSTIPLAVALLMVRRSMFIGWWQFIRHPKLSQLNNDDEEMYIIPRKRSSDMSGLSGKTATPDWAVDKKSLASPTSTDTGGLLRPSEEVETNGGDRPISLDASVKDSPSMPAAHSEHVSSRHTTLALLDELESPEMKELRRRSSTFACQKQLSKRQSKRSSQADWSSKNDDFA